MEGWVGGVRMRVVADAIGGRMASLLEVAHVHGVNVARSSGLPAARINMDNEMQSLSS